MDKRVLRRVLLIVTSALNWAFSAGYVRELYVFMMEMEFIRPAGELTVDGEDFSPFAELAFTGVSRVLIHLSAAAYTAVSAVFILIFSLLLRAVTKRLGGVTRADLKFAGRTIAVSSLLAFVAGILLSNTSLLKYVVALSWQQPLFMWLVYYRGVKKLMIDNVKESE